MLGFKLPVKWISACEHFPDVGPYMEIMDAELYAVYRALEHLKQQRLEEKQVYIFIDSQAAIKRL